MKPVFYNPLFIAQLAFAKLQTLRRRPRIERYVVLCELGAAYAAKESLDLVRIVYALQIKNAHLKVGDMETASRKVKATTLSMLDEFTNMPKFNNYYFYLNICITDLCPLLRRLKMDQNSWYEISEATKMLKERVLSFGEPAQNDQKYYEDLINRLSYIVRFSIISAREHEK